MRYLPTSFNAAATILSLFYLLHFAQASARGSEKLPIVDLGYVLQQATYFNDTGGLYNFSNIRYAAPPIGEHRFRAPRLPLQNRSHVQTGLPDRICPQATPDWLAISEQFLTPYLKGQTVFIQSSFNLSLTKAPQPSDPRTTEDCLFLDVIVPRSIFEKAGRGKGSPVMVWIYGGGYSTGSKSYWGNPAGLIDRSETGGAEGLIYVSMNYRLGAFGWLSGPTFQTDGVANAGLLDQRLALEWVQKYIHLFGGDPERVTVFGESAGGGSIMHQITAYGGRDTQAPFQQALAQSPAFFPVVSNHQQEETLSGFLRYAGVGTIEDARKLSSTELIKANLDQVRASPYGKYTYGPVVDGSFVPALPGLLLKHGQYSTDVKIMVAHNVDEGLLFTTPFAQDESSFEKAVESFIPTIKAWPAIYNHLATVLYPSNQYGSQIARLAAVISDLGFVCNTIYLSDAFCDNTYAYYFSVPPSLHGLDIPYTYFNGPNPSVLSDPVAITLQKYITHWAETGDPNEHGVPFFPMYGGNDTVQNLNVTHIGPITDPASKNRCAWWQKALYL